MPFEKSRESYPGPARRFKLTSLRAALRLVVLSSMLVAAADVVMAAPHGLKFGKSEGKDLAGNAGRDALRQIVQEQCVPDWLEHQSPAPCERVFLADDKSLNSGYVILADKKGAAHYLLIPTQTMHGVDAEELFDVNLPNYFAQAWKARDILAKFVGHPVARTAVGLAVNNAHSRTQDQFHIHIDCLRQEVVDTLSGQAENVTAAWGPITVLGAAYQVRRIEGLSLDAFSPFDLVAQLGPQVKHHIGDYTVVIAGMQYASGAGFMLITGTGQTGELLLDSSCAVAAAVPQS